MLGEPQRSTIRVGESVSGALQRFGLYGRKKAEKKAVAGKRKKNAIEIPFGVCHKPRGRHSKHVEEG